MHLYVTFCIHGLSWHLLVSFHKIWTSFQRTYFTLSNFHVLAWWEKSMYFSLLCASRPDSLIVTNRHSPFTCMGQVTENLGNVSSVLPLSTWTTWLPLNSHSRKFILGIPTKISLIQMWLQSDKNNRHFIWTPTLHLWYLAIFGISTKLSEIQNWFQLDKVKRDFTLRPTYVYDISLFTQF
jgi:hypothetical protein